MNTTESNKVIAEFMGGLYKSNLFAINDGFIWLPLHNLTAVNYLKYHSSWDWLMPVVEKIESLEDDVERFDITKYECRIQADTMIDRKKCSIVFYFGNVFKADFKTKQEAVYAAVVTFIKWYNENK